jgi:hypothetical protein
MFSICSPAIIYVVFSITQIIIDTYNGFYNTALVKIIVMVMVTLLLNILCERGLGVISWIIVFIPFILMTVIVTLLLYFFGLNATTGTINVNPRPNVLITNQNSNLTPPNYTTSPYYQEQL